MNPTTLQALQERRGNMEGVKSIKAHHAFFGVMGGGAYSLLRECSPPVQELRSMRGLLLFVTVLTSALLAGLAWALVSESAITGIVVGLVWFVLVGVLDRNLMSTLDGDGKGQAMKRASLMVARLLVIVIMAHLNSHFVQLWMFDEEIQTTLKEDKQKKLSGITEKESEAQAKYQTWYGAERARIDDAWKGIRERQDQLVGEIAGRVGSGRQGDGPAAKAQREALAREEANLKKEEVSFKEATESGVEAQALAQAKKDSEEARDRINNKKKSGFSDRSDALAKVAEETSLVYWMYALFFLIECLAFLAKMFSRSDEYDFRITRERQVAEDRIQRSDMLDVASMRAAVLDDLHNDRDAQADAATTRKERATAIKDQLAAKLDEFQASAQHGIDGMASLASMKVAKVPTAVITQMEERLGRQVVGFPDPDDIVAARR